MAFLNPVSVHSVGGNGNKTARVSPAGALCQGAECWPRSPPLCSSFPSEAVFLKQDPSFGRLLWNHICGKRPPYFDFTLDFMVVTAASMGIWCQQPSMSYCWPHTHSAHIQGSEDEPGSYGLVWDRHMLWLYSWNKTKRSWIIRVSVTNIFVSVFFFGNVSHSCNESASPFLLSFQKTGKHSESLKYIYIYDIFNISMNM